MADMYNEMQSLTLNGKKYDSFRDQTARQQLEELKNNGSDSTQNGNGLSTTAVNLLMDVLNAVQYHTNVSGKIEQLREALLSGAGSGDTGGDAPDEPDEPAVTDDITVSNGVMTIVTVGSAIIVSDGVMAIA